MTKKKEQRSNKWGFLIYQDSAPENYLDILEELHIPYVLSPWHDKDVNKSTGEIKKAHKHGALFFETLKSYSQVSDLLKDKLNSPAHVEVVMSPKGMYDYFYSIYVDFSSRSQLYSREKSWAWSFWSLGGYDYRLGIPFTIIWNPLF